MRRNARDGLSVFGWTVLILAFLAVVSAIAIFLFGGLSQVTANFRGKTEKKEQVEGSGAFRRAANDSFYNQCAGIQQLEAQRDAMIAERDDKKHPPTDSRMAQINATLPTIRAQRDGAIAQYNADAANGYTTGQFRAANLPEHLNKEEKNTTCNF